MKRLLSAFTTLTSSIEGNLGRAARAPADPTRLLRRQSEWVKQLVAGLDKRDVPPPQDRVAAARREWKASGGTIGRLTSRTIRTLCCDADTALTGGFVRAIGSHPDLHRRKRWLEPLVRAYFDHWRAMDAPDDLEKVLRSNVRRYEGSSRLLTSLKGAERWLFTGEAAERLAREAVKQRIGAPACAAHFGIGAASGLARHACDSAAHVWVEELANQPARRTQADTRALIEYLFTVILVTGPVTTQTRAAAVSELVCSPVVEASEPLRELVKMRLLKHPEFGDPRLPANAARWSVCSAAARTRFVGWLARRDLRFFFEAVITTDPHGRKPFWLRYVDAAVNSSVALSSADLRRLQARLKEEAVVPSRTDDQTVSAFIMQFKGYSEFVVVEFSLPNNAVYVHELTRFLSGNRSISQREFGISRDLKRRPARAWFAHHGPWEQQVDAFMAQMGVRPR